MEKRTVGYFCTVISCLLLLINKAAESRSLNKTLPGLNTCGLVQATDKLYGSRLASIGEYPWVARIEYRDTSTGELKGIKCVGSLINNRYVLTAAHCLSKSPTEPFRVWLGDWKISTDPDCIQQFSTVTCGDPVEKVTLETKIPHENFNKGTGENDIALLRLNREVTYTEFVQPVCLATKEIPQEDRLVVVSWGTVADNGTDTLQSVTLPYVANEECEKALKRKLSNKVFCAGGEKGLDTCVGDGGAPIVKVLPVYNEEISDLDLRWFQYGITSWGVGCGQEGYPAVYTSVFKYTEWIAKHIFPKK